MGAQGKKKWTPERERWMTLSDGRRGLVIGRSSELSPYSDQVFPHCGYTFSSFAHALVYEEAIFWGEEDVAREVGRSRNYRAAKLITRSKRWKQTLWNSDIKAALIRILSSKADDDEGWVNEILLKKIRPWTRVYAAGTNPILESGIPFSSKRLESRLTHTPHLPGSNLFGTALEFIAALTRSRLPS